MKLLRTPNPQSIQFAEIRSRLGFTRSEMAKLLNTSPYALVRWERGDLIPNQDIVDRLHKLLETQSRASTCRTRDNHSPAFASHGSTASLTELPLFPSKSPKFLDSPRRSILTPLYDGSLWSNGEEKLAQLLSKHSEPATTVDEAVAGGVSAGKNTYTYDAHTYHTKVPPQGIAQIISRYLPQGGLVLDVFAGSGMTGVAALVTNHDVILNELSPAASFISYVFTKKVDSGHFTSAINAVCNEVKDLRHALYTTECRECGKSTEILYTVWSYEVACTHCNEKFVLWNHCRKYGRTVRDHKLLREFACPNCGKMVRKSNLKRYRNLPVVLGYKCCQKTQIEHPVNDRDLQIISSADELVDVFRPLAPTNKLPDGVNLGQPRRHGLTSIDRFYTPRNLSAAAALWREIRRIQDPDLSAAVGFVFTSLYQRITRLSEYRFWGGSGNTANFNVPYISNEANVFVTFLRKAKSIADHFSTTAAHYTGNAVVRTGSGTDLSFLPSESIDFIFTDPPFGANINYGEMNILWESWLGAQTDLSQEAIVNRIQGKGVKEYQELISQSLREAYRVLRQDHWMVIVFMNSSAKIWEAIRHSIIDAGFQISRIDIFDKQHGTFKQFVSDNTAGSDLMIHCRKATDIVGQEGKKTHHDLKQNVKYENIFQFLTHSLGDIPIVPFLHVRRENEIDYRTLYSKYISTALSSGRKVHGFGRFRVGAKMILEEDEMMANLRAFTGRQRRTAKLLLAGKVATMMGRKMEEGDWSEIYCRAKNIPEVGWSNVNIDVEYRGLGVEFKMLRVKVSKGGTIKEVCGTTQMHPALTRSIRIEDLGGEAQDVMEEVFLQYAELVDSRTGRVRRNSDDGSADMRLGWLLWENSLTEFLYFEERMIAPSPERYYARWNETPPRGNRKGSRSLWVFDKETHEKRYSITTTAGIKIQPYFDVPLVDDPELTYFRVQNEPVDPDTVLLWIASSTADQLKEKLGSIRREVVNEAIENAIEKRYMLTESLDEELTRAVPIAVSRKAFDELVGAWEAVSDEHRIQLLLRGLG